MKCGSLLALGLALTPTVVRGAERPVGAIGSQALRVSTPRGSGIDPCLMSLDWSKPQPAVTRAVIVFHGKGRNVESYYRSIVEAADLAGPTGRDSVLIAPQFLDKEDIDAHRLSGEVLRWQGTDWESGAPAAAPISISPFEIVDAALAHLADRTLFPNLKNIVLAGHSGGAQLVQRYAVVGRAPAAISEGDIHLRFVIANPSSYVYFSDERPGPSKSCRDFNHWKYGLIDPPSYVQQDARSSWPQLEAEYAQRDVIYLLGTADTDPHEKDLDVSCSGKAQGATRFARGQAYFAYLHNRHPSGWNQRLWFVPGVAHSAHKMFTSACGVNALFDSGRCPDQ